MGKPRPGRASGERTHCLGRASGERTHCPGRASLGSRPPSRAGLAGKVGPWSGSPRASRELGLVWNRST